MSFWNRDSDPWYWAPLWAIDLREMVNELLELERASRKQEIEMSKELDDLTAQVAANSTVVGSAIALINGIADRITAAGVDVAKLQALTDELRTQDEALGTAVVSNTPVTPTP